ncbi:MAG: DsrE family protein [Actinomycetota bacterium]|nr:DsrE family protein [Actinomycetota bacterium]
MAKLIFGCSHGRDDAERATLPFIAANVAASAGQDAYVLLTVEGAWLATKDYADGIHFEGMPALRPLLEEFLDNGGTVWACGACTKPRAITEDHLIPGAHIVGAAKVVEEVVAGAQNITFA